MKEEINFSQFCDRFIDMNRNDNFTYDGKKALFDYLEELENDCDVEYDLDVIALCCEYNEYSNLKEYLVDYNTDVEEEDYNGDVNDYENAILEEIRNKTTLITVGHDDGFIIQAY